MIQNFTPKGPFTPSIIEVVKEPVAHIDMIQVAVAAFGLLGVIMGTAAVAGLVAGAAFIWYRRRRPASTVESRGYDHNFFRAH